jgi:tRNA (guanine26-N2/guanine27-N2)-dimethyltransferase
MDNFIEITEGQTKLLVPRNSLEEKVPPHSPAFFNPLARLNRDLSIHIYNTFLDEYNNNKNNQITYDDAF